MLQVKALLLSACLSLRPVMLQVKALLLSACLSEASDVAGESPSLVCLSLLGR